MTLVASQRAVVSAGSSGLGYDIENICPLCIITFIVMVTDSLRSLAVRKEKAQVNQAINL